MGCRVFWQKPAGLLYCFCSKYMSKTDHYRKKTEPTPLDHMTDDHAQKKVMETIRAIEIHVELSCIVMGTV